MTPLMAWYGDDFTGSAAVLEVLAFAGVSGVLFLKPPTAPQRDRFSGAQAVGLAGAARAQSPQWMETNLPAVYEWLRDWGAEVVLYKVCSTLDSAPQIGSIGRAIDIGQRTFASDWVPCLVAAPQMRRYQCFGHLFAGAPRDVYRLDRHPVMARHPVTPMQESDVALHLAAQTDRPFGLVDLAALADDTKAAVCLAQVRQEGAEIVTLDAQSEADMRRCGALIWQSRQAPQFAVGSQGVAYALVAHWADAGVIPTANPVPQLAPVDQILAVSGSVSPVTADQIDHAAAHGFSPIALDAAAIAIEGAASRLAIDAAREAALAAYRSGQSPLIYTARGPDDPAVAAYRQLVATSGLSLAETNRRIGSVLGQLLRDLIKETGAPRVVISGGDSSSHAAQELNIFALEALAPVSPGAAMFRAASEDPAMDGLQIALKGGQMGRQSCFCDLRDGVTDQINP
ncbi:four-carbon acid sugar kinase family protein [Sulfitobacter mediterraneus]|uniref:four-carbon acid sugar kinase family protein n=1 Tax=Sulfitobacter mediterraneus TaxID=83219 RepID=UPI000EA0ADE0|nr:four-carbon acid sugar kinase family protein [Sulfitobacter mediterraneus]